MVDPFTHVCKKCLREMKPKPEKYCLNIKPRNPQIQGRVHLSVHIFVCETCGHEIYVKTGGHFVVPEKDRIIEIDEKEAEATQDQQIVKPMEQPGQIGKDGPNMN